MSKMSRLEVGGRWVVVASGCRWVLDRGFGFRLTADGEIAFEHCAFRFLSVSAMSFFFSTSLILFFGFTFSFFFSNQKMTRPKYSEDCQKERINIKYKILNGNIFIEKLPILRRI